MEGSRECGDRRAWLKVAALEREIWFRANKVSCPGTKNVLRRIWKPPQPGVLSTVLVLTLESPVQRPPQFLEIKMVGHLRRSCDVYSRLPPQIGLVVEPFPVDMVLSFMLFQALEPEEP
jgi:hypothetical protein